MRMADSLPFPCSAKNELDGLIYFPRMLDKIRLHLDDKLHADYQDNLGKALDLAACQLLAVDYLDLAEKVLEGATDSEVLEWAYETGKKPEVHEKAWWCSYVRNLGFRDHLAERLATRIAEAGLQDREHLFSFIDFMDAEEGHDIKSA